MPQAQKGKLAALAPKVPKAAEYKPDSCIDVFCQHGQVPGGKIDRPVWLQPLADILDDAAFRKPEGVGIVTAHAPPRHSKSSLLQSAVVLAAIRNPGENATYITCSQDLALSARARVEAMAISAGLAPAGHDAELRFRGGFKCRFTSVGSSLVGHDSGLLMILDDVVGSRADYDSPSIRKRTEEWFVAEALSRQARSIICSMHRWGTLDLSAFLQREYDAPFLRIPAICDALPDPCGRSLGQALWPSRYPLQKLALAQRNRDNWVGQWQGIPLDLIANRFGEPTYFTMPVPIGGEHRVIYGCDLAYSGASGSDWSVLVRCVRTRGQLYVTDAVLIRAELAETFAAFKVLYSKDPGAVIWWGAAQNELDVVRRMRESGFRVETHSVQGLPKHQRAIPLIAAYNAGDVLLNRDMQHRAEIVEQLARFVEGSKSRDDFIDAAGSALIGAGLHRQGSPDEGLIRIPNPYARESTADAIRDATASERSYGGGARVRSARREEREFWFGGRDD